MAAYPIPPTPEAPTFLGTMEGFGSIPAAELWNDPLTRSTFALHAGETLADALGRVRASFGEA